MKIPGKYLVLFLIISILSITIFNYCSNQETTAINRPNEELPTSVEKIELMAVSKGERILVQQVPWLNDEQGIKKVCQENWELKVGSKFDEFIEKCPIDIEAKIYSNNRKTREKAAQSASSVVAKIAIVVPISGNKKNLKLNPEIKFNGLGVFNSIEILKGIEVVQREGSMSNMSIQMN